MRGPQLARHLLLPLLAILVLFTPVTEARVRDFLRATGANKIAIRVKPVMVSSAKHQADRRKKGQKVFDQPKVPNQAETQQLYGQQVFPTYWIHC